MLVTCINTNSKFPFHWKILFVVDFVIVQTPFWLTLYVTSCISLAGSVIAIRFTTPAKAGSVGARTVIGYLERYFFSESFHH